MRRLLDRRIQTMCFVAWCAAWLLVAAILLMPVPVSSPHRFDLVVHFGTFGLMAFGAVSFARQPLKLVALTLLTITGAAALECAQHFAPYRSFDLLDMTVNMLGALTGCALALAVLVLIIHPADAAPRAARG